MSNNIHRRSSLSIAELRNNAKSIRDGSWDDNDGKENESLAEDEVFYSIEALLEAESSMAQHSQNNGMNNVALTASYDILPTSLEELVPGMETQDNAFPSLTTALSSPAHNHVCEKDEKRNGNPPMSTVQQQASALMRPHYEFKRSDSGLENHKISRIERSWLVIIDNNRVGQVGEKVFFRMFEDYPDLVQLFPFGQDDFDAVTGRLKINNRTRVHVQAHASVVMQVIGSAVAGKISVEDLVPRLRSVGATHKIVGVQNMHYDILYRHLVTAIREEVGPENWDQDTEDAWEQAFLSITDLIKRPSKRLETEPLMGWGTVMLAACTYFTLVTPFRFAGFYIGHPLVICLLDVLDFTAAFVMFLDLMIDTVQTKFRVSRNRFIDAATDSEGEVSGKAKPTRLPRENPLLRFVGKYVSRNRKSIVKTLTLYKMDRWVPWPSLDLRVLLSFVLQGLFVHSSLCTRLGLHWTQLFGLLRISCASRVLHFIQCAENNCLLRQKLDADRQLILRIVKLVIQLGFITHVCACLYCALARLELGYEATEFTPSAFFPDVSILYGTDRNVFTCYSRAVHWAFVSLSGIGNTDSVPSSTLECWFTLVVHMVGAVFYAIVTGVVISTLEARAERDNKMGSEIARLSTYLTTARMSKSAKERIMKGYMMRNVLTDCGTENAGSRIANLDQDEEILGTLPNYLKMEVGIYARAEMIHRREKLFLHCSNSFLVALSSSLPRTRTLISGDYLMREGESFTRDFFVVESGKLQIQRGNNTIKTLERGNCIGRAWLLQLKNESSHHHDYSENTDWIRIDGIAACSIRAVGPCVLVTGLTSRDAIQALEKQYPVDFQLLRAEVRGEESSESERKAKAIRGISKAVRRFKERNELWKESKAAAEKAAKIVKTE